MAKTRITIRLYRAHDLDLITFTEIHKLDIQKAVYCALSSFVSGDLFLIEIPKLREEVQNLRRVYAFILTLDDERERDVKMLEVLSKINAGRRNNFLKNLLRLYLCNPMSEDFLVNEEDAEFFYGKFEIFRKGRKIANLSEREHPKIYGTAELVSKKRTKDVFKDAKTSISDREIQDKETFETDPEAKISHKAKPKSDKISLNTIGNDIAPPADKAGRDMVTGSDKDYNEPPSAKETETVDEYVDEAVDETEDAMDIFASILNQ